MILSPTLAANRVLDDLCIDSKEDLLLLEEIAYERGAIVRYIDLQGALARLLTISKPAIITISTSINNMARRRFSIAHELGHLELHKYRKQLLTCSDFINFKVYLSVSNLQKLEIEANQFAAHLLMPGRLFLDECKNVDPSFDVIREMAYSYSVSLTACAIQFTQFSKEPVAIVFTENNKIKWFSDSESFKELREDLNFFIKVNHTLSPESIASKYNKFGSIPGKMFNVPAMAWFTGGVYRENAMIKEQSLALPRYNSIITLLWIYDEIDDDYY
jgi:Zn-dependent peptidase ImmA (M78 family)